MKTRRLWLVLAAAGLSANAAWGQALQKDFTVHFRAPKLEPGLGGQAAPPGTEMAAGDIVWDSSTTGRIPVSMWVKGAVVSFEVFAGAVKVTDVDLGHRDRPGAGGWEAWRQQHAYHLAGQNYFWLPVYELHEEPLDAATGAGYDQAILGVWKYWGKKTVERKLANLPVAAPGAAGGADELTKTMAMRYDGSGLVGTAWGDFYIRIWGIPVHVRFEVKPAAPDEFSDWIIQPGDIYADYDPAGAPQEWRRRYGYGVDSNGDYAWDKDFPDPKPDIAAFGPKLDELMQRCMRHWAQATVALAMQGLDAQLKDAVAKAPPAASSAGQAQGALKGIQAQKTWPQ